MKLLAQRGANLQAKDKRGRTALDLANASGRGGRGAASPRKAALLADLITRSPF